MKCTKIKYGRRGGEEVIITKDWTWNEEGELAIRFAERFALISAIEDGYDKMGRQKLRLLTPKEVTQRACELAEKMVAALRKREWILDLPTPEPPQPPEELEVRPVKDQKPKEEKHE
jgi:hypothetical protein